MEFFVVFSKHRKKLFKFNKINNVRNKLIIDVEKMSNDNKINIDAEQELNYLKIKILLEINKAISKKKRIFFLPWWREDNKDDMIAKLIDFRDILPPDYNYSLLILKQSFDQEDVIEECVDNTEYFDFVHIFEDI